MIIANIASRSYTPGQTTIPINVSAALTYFTLAFSCVGWPTGDVVDATILWSNGMGGGVNLDGGQVDKHGSPLTSVSVSVSKPAGITQGTIKANVLQAITTAISVTAV